MQFPELTDSNRLAIEALTKISVESLDPTSRYQEFAKGMNLAENFDYFQSLYPDFEDYNFLHDSCPHQQIYLNDFDFNLETDREHLAQLMRLEFKGNTFETIASCGCSTGGLRGNYLLGSGRVCPRCGNEVERFLDKGNQSKLWLKTPEGVAKFINIGVYNNLLTNIKVSKTGPVCLPQYFMSSKYRRKLQKEKIGSVQLVEQILNDLDIKKEDVCLNTFVERYDDIMEFLLNGPGLRTYTKIGVRAPAYYEIYKHSRDVVFSDYLKVPNRQSTILENSGRNVYATKNQLEVNRLIIDIADTKRSDDFYALNVKDIRHNNDVVGNSLVELSEILNGKISKSHLFGKYQLSRHHVSSGSIPFTGRAIIASETGILDNSKLIIPWRMALNICYYHIFNAFYRDGLSPKQAAKKFNLAGYAFDEKISKIFERVEQECKSAIQAGRNPSNEYLSLRVFFMKVNRCLEDESIHIPILACGEYNSDFDGDQMYVMLLLDNESKAKSYGALGHQQMLDKNKLFTVGGYAAQTATNLMNLNTMMIKTKLK